MNATASHWKPTQIPGLEVRSDKEGVVAMRLLGWEGMLSLPLVRLATALPSAREGAHSVVAPARREEDHAAKRADARAAG
ncbi:hypothetical protein [Streptomyces sp. NPDC004685]